MGMDSDMRGGLGRGGQREKNGDNYISLNNKIF